MAAMAQLVAAEAGEMDWAVEWAVVDSRLDWVAVLAVAAASALGWAQWAVLLEGAAAEGGLDLACMCQTQRGPCTPCTQHSLCMRREHSV